MFKKPLITKSNHAVWLRQCKAFRNWNVDKENRFARVTNQGSISTSWMEESGFDWKTGALDHNSWLRIRCRFKSVDFHNAKEEAASMSYDYAEPKNSFECLLGLRAFGKFVTPSTNLHRQS
ncbi:hypothetical protein TNCV_2702661 [Trichonephila clavipes]|nr:hypothetical protein TNCV_2702661 [Trichonephila clavipes]